MSTYPVLTIDALKTRCYSDIEKFKTDLKITINEYENNKLIINLITFDLTVDTTANGIDAMKTIMDKYKNAMIFLFQKDQSKKGWWESGITMDLLNTNFDYSHDVKLLDTEIQPLFWCLRTFLFYQLLCFSVTIMGNQELYNAFIALNTTTGTDKLPYIQTISNTETNSIDLSAYELGIFGSMNPTSDIDVGIKYKNLDRKTDLNYVISVIEDTFIHLLGVELSLKLDIEIYADMYLITKDGKDVFYLDSSEFKEEDFLTLLPYVAGCMLRNYVFAIQATNPKAGSVSEILNIIPINWNNFLSEKPGLCLSIDTNLEGIDKQTLVGQLKSVENLAKEMVIEYLNKPTYNEKKKLYINTVKLADEKRQALINKIYPDTGVSLTPVKSTEVANVSAEIAKTLLYRAESYVSPTTIMHIVRIFQAMSEKDKIDPNKYVVNYPECINYKKNKEPSIEPECGINKYGYLLSILEQYGYIHRFYLTYCVSSDIENTDCKKKIKKYNDRIIDGKGRYKVSLGLEKVESVKAGRRKTKKSTKKQTRKYTRKSAKKQTKKLK